MDLVMSFLNLVYTISAMLLIVTVVHEYLSEDNKVGGLGETVFACVVALIPLINTIALIRMRDTVGKEFKKIIVSLFEIKK